MDILFKALADQSRRHLLDQLRLNDGQSLTELCSELSMSRQAVSKHLKLLCAANLVIAIQSGRVKKHYLNPVPIQEMVHRWVDEFQLSKTNAVINLKQKLENNLEGTQ